jgi:DNA-binding CsgD family transcriptional regulator
LARVGEDGESVEHATPVAQEPLTAREREVLRLVIEGCTNKEDGIRLQISYRTFESHRAHLMRKLGAKNAVELMKLALLMPGTLCDTPSSDATSIKAAQA